MATELLFVYGSLKRNGRHHAELRGAPFIAEAQTAPGYALVPVGDYLALVAEPEAASVSGELFVVDEALLSELDEFEGDDYMRAELLITVQNGENLRALAYLARTC